MIEFNIATNVILVILGLLILGLLKNAFDGYMNKEEVVEDPHKAFREQEEED